MPPGGGARRGNGRLVAAGVSAAAVLVLAAVAAVLRVGRSPKPASATSAAAAATPAVSAPAPSYPQRSAASAAGAAGGPGSYQVLAGHTLHERPAPDGNTQSLGVVNGGQDVTITCQTSGGIVYGTDGQAVTVWDLLGDGDYITDAFVDTNKGSDGFDVSLPRC